MREPLTEIIDRIVQSVDPDKIILFGSRVKKEKQKFSDYDICVLKSGVEHKRKLAQQIYRKLFGTGAAVDIIIETPEKFEELKDKWFLIYNQIAKHGKILYEK